MIPQQQQQQPVDQEFEKELLAIQQAKINPGEYQVHIFVQQTRGLINPSDNEGAVDPIIRIKLWNSEKLSKVKKSVGTGQTYWGEHFFFNRNVTEKSEIEGAKIEIQILNHKSVLKNGLIGGYDLDLIEIYNSTNRLMPHKWLALTNLNKAVDKIVGFVQVAIAITGKGDSQKFLGDEVVPDTGLATLDEINVLYPPQMKFEQYQLNFDVISGECLKKTDTFGSIDGKVQFEFAAQKWETKAVKNNRFPNWYTRISFCVNLPMVNDIIIGRLIDYNSIQKDEVLGSFKLSFKKLQAGGYSQLNWINVYGPQPGAKSKWEKIMINNEELGTDWKGRILLRVEGKKVDQATPPSVTDIPTNEVQKLRNDRLAKYGTDQPQSMITASDLKKKPSQPQPPVYGSVNLGQPVNQMGASQLVPATGSKNYYIYAQVLYGMYLPENSQKYTIHVRWGEVDLSTSKKEARTGLVEWYETLPGKEHFLPTQTSEQPDVFIYLRQGNDIVSYARRKPSEFFNKFNEASEIIFLQPDRGFSSAREIQAGIIKMNIAITDVRQERVFQDISPQYTEVCVCINLFQAANIVPGDSSGTSDPFLRAYYYGHEKESLRVNGTLNPLWYQRVCFPARIPSNLRDFPPIILSLWDYDGGGDHDFLGVTILNLQGFAPDWRSVTPPSWHNLMIDSKTAFGKLLASVTLYTTPPPPENYLNISIPTEPHVITMTLFGMRNLKSRGTFSVNRPYIQFDLDNIRIQPLDKAISVQKVVETPAKEGGSNPHFGLWYSFDAELPINPDFIPALGGRVLDKLIKGLSTPLLGTFTIELKEYRNRTKKDFQKLIERILAEQQNAALKLQQQQQQQLQLQQQEQDIFASGKSNQVQPQPIEDRKKPGIIDLEKGPEGYSKLHEDEEESLEFGVSGGKVEQTQGQMHASKALISSTVVKPKYKQDSALGLEVEIDTPDTNQYVPLGFNVQGEKKKHYRRDIGTDLEKSPAFLGRPPFDEFPIMRGQKVGDLNFFQKMLGLRDSPYQEVGLLKAKIEVFTQAELKELQEKHGSSYEVIQREKLKKEFLQKTKVQVRLYVIDAQNLTPKDDDSHSDPYLKIKFGKQVIDESKAHQTDEVNPYFGKMYDLQTTLPGASELVVEVWDYDALSKNDLIGRTTIDIENRYFSRRFRKLTEIPIETRELMNPTSEISQGKIRLWVEIFNPEQDKIHRIERPIWDIRRKPPGEYELRVIVWNCEDIPNVDWEDASDIYFKVVLSDGSKRTTDTHIRCTNGNGSFNWRMVFPVTLPMKSPTLEIQGWDKDLMSGNDFICSSSLDFSKEANLAFEHDIRVKKKVGDKKSSYSLFGFEPQDPYKFKVPLRGQKRDKGALTIEEQGFVVMSLELVPKAIAETDKVGQGRGEPNQNPFLPAPEGRFEFTMNPFKLMRTLCGTKFQLKLCIGCLLCICLVILFVAGPTIFGNWISKLFF